MSCREIRPIGTSGVVVETDARVDASHEAQYSCNPAKAIVAVVKILKRTLNVIPSTCALSLSAAREHVPTMSTMVLYIVSL